LYFVSIIAFYPLKRFPRVFFSLRRFIHTWTVGCRAHCRTCSCGQPGRLAKDYIEGRLARHITTVQDRTSWSRCCCFVFAAAR
jgi:hypothetical protein